MYIQELRTGRDLQQLQGDVNAVLGEGQSLIHTSPVGVDTSDIESTVDSVGKLLTGVNQRVMHMDTSLATYMLHSSMTNIYSSVEQDYLTRSVCLLAGLLRVVNIFKGNYVGCGRLKKELIRFFTRSVVLAW